MSAMDDGAKWMFIQANKSKAVAIVRKSSVWDFAMVPFKDHPFLTPSLSLSVMPWN
jgi:hypothetical protein